MLKRVRIQGYRCFRDVEVELKPLQILVGPNGSGKSAFLDAIRFVEDIVWNGLRRAVERRAWDPEELFWGGKEQQMMLELSWEMSSREEATTQVVYAIALEREKGDLRIVSEHLSVDGRGIYRRIGLKVKFGEQPAEPWDVEPHQSVLRTLFELTPPLMKGIVKRLRDWWSKAWPKFLHPEPNAIRRGGFWWKQPRHHFLYPDARNVPRRMLQLQEAHPEAYQRWLRDLKLLMGQPVELRVHLDEINRTYHLTMRQNGVWFSPFGISEGWLRFIALSLPAYDPENEGRIFFIEEIENGLSPDAIRLIFEILIETPNIQWLITTHHPLLIHLAGWDHLLIFAKDEKEAHVIPGTQHPLLADLRPEDNLSELFMAGVFS